MSKKVNGVLLFIREFLRNPLQMGAALPSSRFLAKAIAKQLPSPLTGQVVELGAGTGAVTEALLAAGVPQESLIVVESSETLSEHLRKRYPKLKIIHGDALDIGQHIQPDQHISVIVSGLPFFSFSKELSSSIVHEAVKILDKNGLFIQFSYNLVQRHSALLKNLKAYKRLFVLRNLPPACIDLYKK